MTNAKSDNFRSVAVDVEQEGVRGDWGVAIEADQRDKVHQEETEVSGRQEGRTDTNTDSKSVLNSGTDKETQSVKEEDWMTRMGVALFPRNIGDRVRQTVKLTENENEQKRTEMNGHMDRPTSYTQRESTLCVMSEEGRLNRFTGILAHSHVRVSRSPGQDCQDSAVEDGHPQAAGGQVRLTLDNKSQGTPGSDRPKPSRTPPGTTSCTRPSTEARPRRREGSPGGWTWSLDMFKKHLFSWIHMQG